jgi:hypothetical protein
MYGLEMDANKVLLLCQDYIEEEDLRFHSHYSSYMYCALYGVKNRSIADHQVPVWVL